MNDIAIRFDHVGKLYKLGLVGTGTLSHDLTLSVSEPDNAAAQTGAGTAFGANGDPLT